MAKKPKGKKRLLTALTLILLLLSGAALGAKAALAGERAKQKSQMTAPEAKIVQSGQPEQTAAGITAGSNVPLAPAVKIEKGTAYVRFTVELQDADGVPFSQKLSEKQQEIDQYEAMLDPDSPSYLAFMETYHSLKNEYNQLAAKGELAFSALCRDNSEGAQALAENNGRLSASELDELSQTGSVTQLSQTESGGAEDSPFTASENEKEPFKRNYTFKKAAAEGEEISLFTNVVIPADWDITTTSADHFTENDDGTFTEDVCEINNLELLGEGFKLSVSAQIVDARAADTAEQAFENAAK